MVKGFVVIKKQKVTIDFTNFCDTGKHTDTYDDYNTVYHYLTLTLNIRVHGSCGVNLIFKIKEMK